MNTARNRTIKHTFQRTFAAMVIGCMAALSWSSSAHLADWGQGDCWARYYAWRDAMFALRDAREDLARYVENLNAALEANNAVSVAFWTFVVAVQQAQITGYYEPRLAEAHRLRSDCEHW